MIYPPYVSTAGYPIQDLRHVNGDDHRGFDKNHLTPTRSSCSFCVRPVLAAFVLARWQPLSVTVTTNIATDP